MKYKVSNVCQLLDKSKFPATQTINGITFTNNEDGTITVNGTATKAIYYGINRFIGSLYLSHKYLVTGESSGLMFFVENRDENGNILLQLNSDTIKTLPSNTKISAFECYIKQGTVCDNLVLKPQFFDLTEMYGAGHEPTTVEQFRQDFPDEYYEYSPECWKNIRRLKYVTETRNLFDKNNVVNGYINEYGILSHNDTWKASDFIPIMSNTSYTISGISYIGDGGFYAWYDTNKNFISSVFNKINSQTMISPSGAAYIRVCYKHSVGDADTLQLELGSTATPYQPYGYLEMKRGKYVTETKNLFVPSTKTGNAGDFSNTTVRNFEENVWYIGLTRNNYNSPGVVYIHEIKDNYIKVATSAAAYGVARAFRVSPNKQYTLSFKGNLISGGMGFGFYDNTGKYLSMTDSVFTITTPANCGWLTVVLGGYPDNTEQYCTDLQLVEGSTATPYQPYRHIAFK